MEIQHRPSRVPSFSRSSSMRSYEKLDQHRVRSPMAIADEDSVDALSHRLRRTRFLLASLCCALALIATITLGAVLAVRARSSHGTSDSDNGQSLSTGSAAITAACNTTMFPDLCYEWLSAEPGSLTANPIGLVDIGVKVALKHVHMASALASKLRLSSQYTNISKQAIEDCIELLDMSTDRLNDSSTSLNSISLMSIKSTLSNVKVKLSGTMGFQLACYEGLEALSEKDGSTLSLLDSQDNVGKGVIISLGLVDTLSKLTNGFSSWKSAVPKINLGRHLLSEEDGAMDVHDVSIDMSDTFRNSESDYFPDWLSAADRKLLQTSTPSTTTPPAVSLSPPTPTTSSSFTPPPATLSSFTPPPVILSGTAPPPVTSSISILTPQAPTTTVAPPTTPPTTPSTSAVPPPISPVTTPSVTPSVSSSPAVSSPGGFDTVVAQDGSGNYQTIQEALNNVPMERSTRYTIYIKAGVYSEYLIIPESMQLLTLVGDGTGQTIITGSKSNAQAITTYSSATVAVLGANFIARKITFRNTAGPNGYQAVALRVNADQAVFDTCSIEGYQDTLYALANRQFYTNCNIYGTVDFIFGNAIAVFQNCNLFARQPLQTQHNTFTAQGREVSSDISGFSFHKCNVKADAELLSSPYSVTSYYGRPWQAYSRTVFMQSSIDSVIDPAGWVEWDATNPYTDTLYYGEYQNTGAGADVSKRVVWKGVHPAMSQEEALSFTVDQFISGSTWLPGAQVSFQLSLS